jgi:NADH-quinone oxidoreductase subunit C
VNAAALAERMGAVDGDVVVARGEVTLAVAREGVVPALASLRGDPELSFDFLASITATDWPEQDPRFWVSYELLSTRHLHRARVKAGVPADDPRIASCTGVYSGANWHEREVFDLFGLVFGGHPDLTRILMPEDWEGHPLRKTEGLGGVPTRYKGAFIPPVDERTS